jgi:hypothetical protein
MRKIIPILGIIILGFAGCTSTDVVEPTVLDSLGYFPVTEGTSWEYKVINDSDTTSMTRKISGDTLLNGKRYSRYMQITDDRTSIRRLYRRSNDTLFHLIPISTQPIQFSEWPHLIEKQEVAWTIPNSKGEPSATDTIRVVAKGISRIVLGKTYNNVLQMEVSSTSTGSRRIKETSFFAKDIGLIENIVPGETMLLVNYTIK